MANIALKVGIDVSKSKFDVCYRSGDGTVSKTYSSGTRSVKEFVGSLPEGSHCVMEATGVYHTRLAYALHEVGIIVSVVNPLVIKNFSRMRMARTKTDRADAELIMEYAEREDPPRGSPPRRNASRRTTVSSPSTSTRGKSPRCATRSRLWSSQPCATGRS